MGSVGASERSELSVTRNLNLFDFLTDLAVGVLDHEKNTLTSSRSSLLERGRVQNSSAKQPLLLSSVLGAGALTARLLRRTPNCVFAVFCLSVNLPAKKSSLPL